MTAIDPVQILVATGAAAALYGGFVFLLAREVSGRSQPRALAVTAYGRDMAVSRGIIECKIIHTRAGRSHVFFDADQWLSDPVQLDETVAWLAKTVVALKGEHNDLAGLAFVEKDAGPAGLLSLLHLLGARTGLRSCIVRLRRWPFLPQAAIKGGIPGEGSKWILVSDVATSGGTIQRAAKVLQHSCWKSEIVAAVVLLNRGGSETVESLASQGIPLLSCPAVDEDFEIRVQEVERRLAKETAA
jgi:orotate phosphoribosyltransferase